MAAADFDGMDKVAATAAAARREFPSGIILGACGRIPLIAVNPANIIETAFFLISPAGKALKQLNAVYRMPDKTRNVKACARLAPGRRREQFAWDAAGLWASEGQIRLLDNFFRLKPADSLFQGVFLGLEKVPLKCPIIGLFGGRFV